MTTRTIATLAALTLLAVLTPLAMAQSAPQQSTAGSVMNKVQRDMQLSSQSLLTGPITSQDLEPPKSIIEYSDVQGGVKTNPKPEPKEEIRQ
jgi:hypothetical protein